VHWIYTSAKIVPIELNSTVLLPTSTRESLVHVCLRALLQEPTINNIVIGGKRKSWILTTTLESRSFGAKELDLRSQCKLAQIS
jgi:hypothetical protein